MASTVDSTLTTALGREERKNTFYHNGRHWVFYTGYFDASLRPLYKTSTDGISWSAYTNLDPGYGGGNVAAWFDGTYVHIAIWYASTTIKYRRGVPNSDGSITWSADFQTAASGGATKANVTICVDSSGYAWIAYGASSTLSAIKNANNDGTWSTERTETVESGTGTPYGSMAPLTNQKMIFVWERSEYGYYNVRVRTWTGSGWNSVVQTPSESNCKGASVVAVGDNAHIVFCKKTSYDVIYVPYTYSTNSLGSETAIASSQTDASNPAISKWSSTEFYCFWENSSTKYVYYVFYNGSSWGSPVQWIDETTDGFDSSYGRAACGYEKLSGVMPVIYETKASSPYNLRYDALILLEKESSDSGSGSDVEGVGITSSDSGVCSEVQSG